MEIVVVDHRHPERLGDLVAARLAFLADEHGTPGERFDAGFVEATDAFVRRATADGVVHSWLALDDAGEVIGAVSMLRQAVPPRPTDLRTWHGYVVNMWVTPAERRRGVARALLDALVAAAPGLGVRQVVLYATSAGRPLYEQAGFAPSPAWMELALDGSGPTTCP